jgi:GH25 family lysozyme M1 (1,4-beta-N-acetylmuramidase)
MGRLSSDDESSEMMQLAAAAQSLANGGSPPPNTGPPVHGVDISNYQADVTLLLPTLTAWNVEHVVVRLSTESEDRRQTAIRQLQILSHVGFTVSGYVWAYFWASPMAHIDAALSVADAAGVPLTMIWFDCEDDDSASPVSVSTWLDQAVWAVQSHDYRAGIYTGRYWWRDHAGDTDRFSHLPLWLANYDEVPELTSSVMPFAGWNELAGKQYTSTPLDRDIFAAFVV